MADKEIDKLSIIDIILSMITNEDDEDVDYDKLINKWFEDLKIIMIED